jgi:hypothetical protein
VLVPMMVCGKLLQLAILIPFRAAEGCIRAVKETFGK